MSVKGRALKLRREPLKKMEGKEHHSQHLGFLAYVTL